MLDPTSYDHNPLLCIPPAGPPFTSPFRFQSYGEQQFSELRLLLDLASASDHPVLMGDFNHGPAVPTPTGVSGTAFEYPFHYGYVNARGFYSPYVVRDGRCTFCLENSMVNIPSRIVDHIYIPVTSSARVVEAKVRGS